MELHPDAFGIQMAATACLYNLTKADLGSKIHPQVLARVVSLCLDAMGKFPTHYQLQKNTLLTLCSDRILQDVPIDRFKCAKLVLDSLHTFEDPSMNRMSVAICSILGKLYHNCLQGFIVYFLNLISIIIRDLSEACNLIIKNRFLP